MTDATIALGRFPNDRTHPGSILFLRDRSTIVQVIRKTCGDGWLCNVLVRRTPCSGPRKVLLEAVDIFNSATKVSVDDVLADEQTFALVWAAKVVATTNDSFSARQFARLVAEGRDEYRHGHTVDLDAVLVRLVNALNIRAHRLRLIIDRLVEAHLLIRADSERGGTTWGRFQITMPELVNAVAR